MPHSSITLATMHGIYQDLLSTFCPVIQMGNTALKVFHMGYSSPHGFSRPEPFTLPHLQHKPEFKGKNK